MNKLYIYGLTVLALGFAACDDIEEGTGLPQTNPQLPTVTSTSVTAQAGPSASSLINLDALNNEGKSVEIARVAAGEDWPEGFTALVPTIQISKTDDFAEYQTIEAATDETGLVTVSPDAWEAAYRELFGKSPVTTESYVRFPIWAVKGLQKVRLGSVDTYYGNFGVEVKPFDLYNGRIVEEEYYLLTSDMNWDLDKAIPLHRVGSNPDVYADGRFASPAVIVNGAGFQWMIIPESAKASGNITGEFASFGKAEANNKDKEGALVANVDGSEATPGLIDVAGPYIFNVDMELLSYQIQLAYENLYTPGDSNGWGFGSGCQKLSTNNYSDYFGFAHLTGGFKFTTDAGWGGINFGMASAPITEEGKEEPGTLSTAGDAGNITVPADGLYWCTANIDALTYNITEITALGIIGDATPGGWDAQTNMSHSADFLTWNITVDLTEGSFKFRGNDNWDINLGGDSIDELKLDGANLQVAEAGKYLIVLDLSALPYKATLTKQ